MSDVKPTCTKSYKFATGDTCYSIWTANQLSEREFRDMNDGIDCDKLEAGKDICVGITNPKNETDIVKPSLPMVESTF